jgi:hypothetical protein
VEDRWDGAVRRVRHRQWSGLKLGGQAPDSRRELGGGGVGAGNQSTAPGASGYTIGYETLEDLGSGKFLNVARLFGKPTPLVYFPALNPCSSKEVYCSGA